MTATGGTPSGSDVNADEARALASLLGLPPADLEAIPPRLVGVLLGHVRLAREDGLTGVANRRGIEGRLAHEWERARRHRHPLSIVLLDVDNLKQINDEQGHAAGDEVLRGVARQLRVIVRSIDFVGRSGGDEFIVICPESNEAAVAVVGHKIESRLSPQVSIGVATLGSQRTPQELLMSADRALYGVKTVHHRGAAGAPAMSVLAPDLRAGEFGRRPDTSSRAQHRPLFSPALAAILVGVEVERLLAWQAAGLIGNREPNGPRGKRSLSLRDLHVIDALKALLKVEVEQSGHRLRTALQAKSDFMRLVAHELKGPITVVRGYTTLLETGSGAQLRESGVEPFGIMETKLADMNELTDQMLDVARLEDGRMPLQEIRLDLCLVLREAVRAVRSASRSEREITVLVPEQAVPVIADERRLLMIVSNLLSNAIKYSPGTSPIECAAAIVDLSARLDVTDRGIGIDEADYARLFKPFERLEKAPEVGGTGLGLYISRELARRFGGDLVATPAEPRGTTFRLELPLARPA